MVGFCARICSKIFLSTTAVSAVYTLDRFYNSQLCFHLLLVMNRYVHRPNILVGGHIILDICSFLSPFHFLTIEKPFVV